MTVTLTPLSPSKLGAPRSFDAEVIRIGRNPASDVAFDAEQDLLVSSNHAEIRLEGGAYVLHDLNSRNGTFVNGERVARTVLQDGDRIEFGEGGPALACALHAEVAATVEAEAPVTVLAAPAEAAAPSLTLEHRSGSLQGTRQTLSGGLLRMGRDPACEVAFDPEQDRVVSATHAEIRLEEGQFVLHDLSSRNGTFVNGHRTRRRVLKDGDEIELGKGGPRVRCAVEGAGETAGRKTAAGAVAVDPLMPLQRLPEAKPESGQVEGRSVGQRTVQMLIREALAEARHSAGGRFGSTTVFMRHVIERATDASSRRLRRASLYGAAALAVCVIALLVVGYVQKQRMEGALQATRYDLLTQLEGLRQHTEGQLTESRQQIRTLEAGLANAATRAQVAALEGSLAQERRRADALAGQLSATQRQIQETQRMTAGALASAQSFQGSARQARGAVYQLGVLLPEGGGFLPFCSAFAVRPDGLLMTNAHCNEGFDGYLAQSPNLVPIAVLDGRSDVWYRVIERRSNPEYRSRNVDIAYLKVDTRGIRINAVPLATPAELADLQSGSDVAVLGYPGEISQLRSQDILTATLFTGTVGRITLENGVKIIQHSCLTSGGTSGSLLINKSGRVVGIHYGGALTTDGGRRSGISFAIHGEHLASFVRSIP